MNVAHLLGRVVTDPTLEEANSGKKICRFRMTTSNGKNHPPTYHYIVIFGKDTNDKHPSNVHNALKRGGKVQITGRISESRWQAKDTLEWRSRTEIIATSVEFVTLTKPSNGETADAVSE
jgi:single stranded DNA-binding protein